MFNAKGLKILPETQQDVAVVLDILNLCERRGNLYRIISQSVDDHNCRNQMRRMAETWSTIAGDLRLQLDKLEQTFDVAEHGKEIESAGRNGVLDNGPPEVSGTQEAGECLDLNGIAALRYVWHLLKEEEMLLDMLRRKVKSVCTASISRILAFHVASLQMAHDSAVQFFEQRSRMHIVGD